MIQKFEEGRDRQVWQSQEYLDGLLYLLCNDRRRRTLMVCGGSPPALKAVQHRLMASEQIEYFNSADHDKRRSFYD